MFDVAWGVFATALGWIVATDFRGAAHRFHALSRAFVPFGGAGVSVVGVGFFRLVAGIFALVGPVVLVSGLTDVWRGEAESHSLPPISAWFVVAEAMIVGGVLWRTWQRSGVLRREWDAGSVQRRVAASGLTASLVAFVVTFGFGWGTWMVVSWLAGGLCGLTLLLSDRPGNESDTGEPERTPE
ncbi:hypothetical protein R6L23_05305 [Streptomyces sp. SR27]|uniref:hypothetical protein n=1 Tax=Streptomyces sp. SR27 TaxID=3076630 RepID=UPI00295ABC6C|nr:hypothetical protein [Streptomyces sp. SR27]MDV9187643.1 hypothetical protein [Streptomyces sp. SR27]